MLSICELYDLHRILVLIRARPASMDWIPVLESICEAVRTSAADGELVPDRVRRHLRAAEPSDREIFSWAWEECEDAASTAAVFDASCYAVMEKALHMLLACAKLSDSQRLGDLADALHNLPRLYAAGCRRIKGAVRLPFSQYDRAYGGRLRKELFS